MVLMYDLIHFLCYVVCAHPCVVMLLILLFKKVLLTIFYRLEI